MSRRSTVKVEDLIEELSIGAAMRLRCDSDDIRHVVKAVVAYLREEYPAQDLYIPAGPRAYPVEDIRRAVSDGVPIRQVCARWRIDRKTVYRLLQQAS